MQHPVLPRWRRAAGSQLRPQKRFIYNRSCLKPHTVLHKSSDAASSWPACGSRSSPWAFIDYFLIDVVICTSPPPPSPPVLHIHQASSPWRCCPSAADDCWLMWVVVDQVEQAWLNSHGPCDAAEGGGGSFWTCDKSFILTEEEELAVEKKKICFFFHAGSRQCGY